MLFTHQEFALAVAVHHDETNFSALDGTNIYEQTWAPATRCRAAVALLHGFAEHSGRYGHVAEHLVQHGYALAAIDLRGHGRSGGPRTSVPSLETYHPDIDQFLERATARFGTAPFLLGHSLGGLVASDYVLMRRPQIAGLVLSAPLFGTGSAVSAIEKWMATHLGQWLPWLPMPIPFRGEAISKDPQVVENFRKDPLVHHGWVPLGMGIAILRAVERVQRTADRLDCPLLVLHSTSDPLTDHEQSKQFYARAQSSDKQLKLYSGLRHELFNEPERNMVLKDLTDWLDQHASASGDS